MKATSALFVLLLIISCNTLAWSQNYHLIYETDIYSIDLKQASIKNSENKINKAKGYQHILSFKDKKAISFQQNTIAISSDSIWKDFDAHQRYLIIDRKKTQSQWVMARYNNKVDKTIITTYDKKRWQEIDPLSEPKLDKESEYISELYKSEYKKIHDSLPTWIAPKLEYTEKTKTINEYACKNAIVIDRTKEINVWYTEEINFNWCFDDYRSLIPGTIIKIECESKTIFELLQIEVLDFEKLSVKKEIIEKLVKLG